MTALPADAVQKAVYTALQGSVGLASVFASMGVTKKEGLWPIYDNVPRGKDGKPNVPYPFGVIGNGQDVPASPTNDCDGEVEHYRDIEWWDESQTRGKTGAQHLASASSVACARILPVTGWVMSVAGTDTVRHLPIADGVARSVVTLRYLLDPV